MLLLYFFTNNHNQGEGLRHSWRRLIPQFAMPNPFVLTNKICLNQSQSNYFLYLCFLEMADGNSDLPKQRMEFMIGLCVASLAALMNIPMYAICGAEAKKKVSHQHSLCLIIQHKSLT